MLENNQEHLRELNNTEGQEPKVEEQETKQESVVDVTGEGEKTATEQETPAKEKSTVDEQVDTSDTGERSPAEENVETADVAPEASFADAEAAAETTTGEESPTTEEAMPEVDPQDFQVGDLVKGKVIRVEEKQAIVEVDDSKLDGILPISEISPLHIDRVSDVLMEGERLTLEVIKVEEDALILSKRRVTARQAWKNLMEKFAAGEYIEAEVKDLVKGGLVVDVGVRGFVPASLVEDYFVEDFSDYKGKTMTFKIVEIEPENNRLILSHRDVVLEEKEKRKKELLANMKVGDILEGTVQRITDFGAFVDIGGIDGLVHISELAHEHVEHPSDVVAVGDTVKVKVLNVDPERERISLSIKETLPGPWENINEKIKEGSIIEGTVKRLVSFGAFVEVLPGVEGLVHISQISHKHIGTPQEVLEVGQKVNVKVLSVNEKEKRISLSIKEAETSEEEPYELPQESSGFQLGEVIGDQLKKFK